MLSFIDMTTLKQLFAGAYPRNSRIARWDRRLLIGTINLALVAALAGTAIDAFNLHFTWYLSNKDPLHLTLAHEHWGTLTMNPDVLMPDLKEKLPQGLEPWNLSVTGKVRNSNMQMKVLSMLSSVPIDLLIVAVIWLVRNIVLTTIGTDRVEGDPFIRDNIRRLRIIAGILLATPLIDAFAQIAESELLSRAFPNVPPETTMLEFNANPMFIYFGVGILMLVLAEVFKAGVQLREDTEGLV